MLEKETFAEAIHNKSKRKSAPFIIINCGVIPEELLESELFGYERDPKGNMLKRPGKFELAKGGTILLDEIAEIKPIYASENFAGSRRTGV